MLFQFKTWETCLGDENAGHIARPRWNWGIHGRGRCGNLMLIMWWQIVFLCVMEKWPKMLPGAGSKFWLFALGAFPQIFAHNHSLCEFTDRSTLMLKDTGCIPRTGTGEWITRNLCECSYDARYFRSYGNLSLWRSVRNFTRQIFSSTAFCVVFLVCLCIFNLKYTSLYLHIWSCQLGIS